MNNVINRRGLDYHERMVKNGLASAKTGMSDAYEHLAVIKDDKMYKEKEADWSVYLKNEFGFTRARFDQLKGYRALLDHVEVIKFSTLVPTESQATVLPADAEKALEQWDKVLDKAVKQGLDTSSLSTDTVRDLSREVKVDEGKVTPLEKLGKRKPFLSDLYFRSSTMCEKLGRMLLEIKRLQEDEGALLDDDLPIRVLSDRIVKLEVVLASIKTPIEA